MFQWKESSGACCGMTCFDRHTAASSMSCVDRAWQSSGPVRYTLLLPVRVGHSQRTLVVVWAVSFVVGCHWTSQSGSVMWGGCSIPTGGHHRQIQPGGTGYCRNPPPPKNKLRIKTSVQVDKGGHPTNNTGPWNTLKGPNYRHYDTSAEGSDTGSGIHTSGRVDEVQVGSVWIYLRPCICSKPAGSIIIISWWIRVLNSTAFSDAMTEIILRLSDTGAISHKRTHTILEMKMDTLFWLCHKGVNLQVWMFSYFMFWDGNYANRRDIIALSSDMRGGGGERKLQR